MGKDEWRGIGPLSIILEQDFVNMEQVQKGMKQDGLPGNRTSRIQEHAPGAARGIPVRLMPFIY